jgi:hypothetical protein
MTKFIFCSVTPTTIDPGEIILAVNLDPLPLSYFFESFKTTCSLKKLTYSLEFVGRVSTAVAFAEVADRLEFWINS